jgi:hypothetical protein
MRYLFTGLLAAVVVTGLTTQSVVGQSADKLYAGTWKANSAKSTYTPGPGPKESTRIHEDRGNGFWLIKTDSVGPQGQKSHGEYVYKPDGKPYPQTGINQRAFQTISLAVVDPYTVTFTLYADGMQYGTGKRTMSKDGKTMTIEQKGTNQQGQPTSSMVLWEKQ